MRILDSYRKLLEQRWRHWLLVMLMIAIGMKVGGYLDEKQWWIEQRYAAYRHLTNLGWQTLQPKDTFVVLIGDEEFWNLELARRIPLKRDYLAKLLRKLDSANPEVIALDIDMRSPFPDGSLIEHRDYQHETAQLIESIRVVSKKRKIVLGATVSEGQHFRVDPDIFQAANFDPKQVTKGFIQLSTDVRQVPLSWALNGDAQIASFAEAIVRASSNPSALENVPPGEALPYGAFMKETAWESSSANATKVLAGDPVLMDRIAHKIVLIGGAWHQRAKGQGDQVDVHVTPAGPMVGVFVHANYVEALLDRRTRTSFKHLKEVLEFFGALTIAVLFASKFSDWGKAVRLSLACLALVFVSYVCWYNLGIFVDFFIPVVMVFLHAMVEKVLEWRHAALAHRKLKS